MTCNVCKAARLYRTNVKLKNKIEIAKEIIVAVKIAEKEGFFLTAYAKKLIKEFED